MLQAEFREVALHIEEPSANWDSPNEKKEGGQDLTKVLTANASLVAWLVFLGFGGAFLTLYYSRIHYFPTIEWKESFSYLAALSLLGIVVAALYGLLLFIPGVVWSEFLIFDTELQTTLCYRGRNGSEPCFWGIWRQVVLPFAILMAAVHLSAMGGWPAILLVSIAGLAGITIFYWWVFLKDVGKRNGQNQQTEAATPSLLLKYVATADVAALASLSSLFLIYAVVDPQHASWLMLVICTVVVVVSNLLVAVQFRHKPGRAVLTGILAALVLLTCGELLPGGRAAFSTRIMQEFGFGGEGQTGVVTLVLTESGRKMLDILHPGISDQNGVVRNAKILSRLGSEYFIVVAGHHVAIQKDMILSWSTDER